MAVTTGRTRQQIRQAIGVTVGAINQDAGTFTLTGTSGSSATNFTNTTLSFGASNEHRGKWIYVTSDTNAGNVGAIRRVTVSSTAGTLTFPALSSATNSGTTIELWDEDMPPQVVNEFINQAITEVTRKGSVSVTESSYHTGGGIREWTLSSNLTGVQEVEWRYQYTGEQLVSMDDAATSGANATVTTDSEDYREGSAANRVNIAAAAASAADLATSSFTATNLAGYTTVEMWAKTNVTTNSSNLRFLLSEGSTVRETLALPALTADSWTRVSVALANAELDTAISRFVLQTGASDGGSATVWIDDVTVIRADAEKFMTLPRKFWSLDKDRRTLRLAHDAQVSDAKIRLNGVRRPNLLTNDTAISDVDAQYVTNSAVAKALRSRADRRGADRDAAYVQADRYEALAQGQRQRQSAPMNIRWLDDA